LDSQVSALVNQDGPVFKSTYVGAQRI